LRPPDTPSSKACASAFVANRRAPWPPSSRQRTTHLPRSGWALTAPPADPSVPTLLPMLSATCSYVSATCSHVSHRAGRHGSSGVMDDLDLVDSAFVVTALSRCRRGAGKPGAAGLSADRIPGLEEGTSKPRSAELVRRAHSRDPATAPEHLGWPRTHMAQFVVSDRCARILRRSAGSPTLQVRRPSDERQVLRVVIGPFRTWQTAARPVQVDAQRSR
jgi:hypothetical protein